MYKLEKPYAEKDRLDFIVAYNHNKCMQIAESETALYALEAWEELSGDTVIDKKEEYEKELELQEQKRINALTMTAQDFLFDCLKDTLNIPVEDIHAFLQKNVELQLRLLTCQNVYCGVVKSLCPFKIGETEVTAEMVERLFKYKHGESGMLSAGEAETPKADENGEEEAIPGGGNSKIVAQGEQ